MVVGKNLKEKIPLIKKPKVDMGGHQLQGQSILSKSREAGEELGILKE